MARKAALAGSPWGEKCRLNKFLSKKSYLDLSKETSLSHNYIEAIISGRVMPSEDAILAISKSLDVDPALYGQS